MHTCAYKRDPQVVDLRCYGLFFMATALGFGLLSSRVVASGHVCPGFGVTEAIATAVPLSRSLNAPGPPRQFSASLDCNAQKDTPVMFVCSNRCCFSEFWTLTFPVLVLLAHRPHADLFVDHIHAGEAASEIEQRHGYCKTDLWWHHGSVRHCLKTNAYYLHFLLNLVFHIVRLFFVTFSVWFFSPLRVIQCEEPIKIQQQHSNVEGRARFGDT